MQDKIAAIAKDIYGAKDVSYDELAERQLKACEDMGGAKLPICMAKTQYSFSADAAAKGAPSGFTLPIRDVKVRPGRLSDSRFGVDSMCGPLCVNACIWDSPHMACWLYIWHPSSAQVAGCTSLEADDGLCL